MIRAFIRLFTPKKAALEAFREAQAAYLETVRRNDTRAQHWAHRRLVEAQADRLKVGA